MVGDWNNQIKIKPTIKLPGALNCMSFSLKADQRDMVQWSNQLHTASRAALLTTDCISTHERQLKQLQRSLMVGSSTTDNSLN